VVQSLAKKARYDQRNKTGYIETMIERGLLSRVAQVAGTVA